MMNSRIAKILTFLLIAGLAVSAVGCKLLHEKVIDLVVRNTSCLDFVERHDEANYVGDVQMFDVALEIDDVLGSLDPPLERSDIDTARLTAVSIEIPWFDDPGHDWEITGDMMISYGQQEAIIASYEGFSVSDVHGMGGPFFLPTLNEAGVDLFNDALYDYYQWGFNPVVSFWIENDSCTPAPSPADSMNFDWTGCLYMYVVSPYETEVVDLFGSD
jgi:hypothetical protein